ncbi:hypothetical protein DEU56DRAFT_915095 [Suillus clintonianus]|uniref:uncharacterized protein n=1 Tax=Suillus clintonianus TaxID=1904413 RepID=UPI001B869D16|nr:uncharacterized protein DEU56DRAFT_915095 [Suillus clintonianus]KAG2129601.1 hypothetical protein DEU56DRAFT_915095 [Suillus clintonianus]
MRPKALTSEQRKTVGRAEERLTEADQDQLARRDDSIRHRHVTRVTWDNESQVEGPSKGKGPDPRNWGGLDLDGTEYELEAQRAALASYKAMKSAGGDLPNVYEGVSSRPELSRLNEGGNEPSDLQRMVEAAVRAAEDCLRKEYEIKLKAVSRNKSFKPQKGVEHTEPVEGRGADPVRRMINRVVQPSKEPRVRNRTPQTMEPVHQVAPESYIGKALGRIDLDDPDDSSSSSSSSSSESESSESTSSSSEDDRPPRKRKTSKKRSKSKKSKRTKTTLKPIPPTVYDGTIDSRAYHRFITEGTVYVEDGKVKSEKKVFVLAHFLKGKAHEFYIREVSGDPYQWRLRGFFTELFNYCFLINFRMKQREKLKHCFQNDKSVRD